MFNREEINKEWMSKIIKIVVKAIKHDKLFKVWRNVMKL